MLKTSGPTTTEESSLPPVMTERKTGWKILKVRRRSKTQEAKKQDASKNITEAKLDETEQQTSSTSEEHEPEEKEDDNNVESRPNNELSLVLAALRDGVDTQERTQAEPQNESPAKVNGRGNTRAEQLIAAAIAARDAAEQKHHQSTTVQVETASSNALVDPSEPSTPVPGPLSPKVQHKGIELPTDENMADYVTPPSPGAPPDSDPQYSSELQQASEQQDENPQGLVAAISAADRPGFIKANTLSPREQEKADEDMLKGIDAFFNNEFSAAEELFRSRATEDPLYSLGLGAMSFIRALLTSNLQDTEATIQKLIETYEFATGQIDAASVKKAFKAAVSDYITNLMGTNTTGLPTNTAPLTQQELKNQPDFLSNGVLRAHVIRAECCLLIAMVYLSQETVIGYLKAGLNLRRAYSSYSLVWQEYKRMGQEFNRYMDKDTISAIQFGIGSVHLLLSSLPAKILRIISAFGWKADKQLGFALLKLCMCSKRIRSSLASIMLLSYYVTLMSYCPKILTRELLQPSIEILLDAQQSYPNSALFLYYAGRIARLSRNIPLSTQSFMYIYDVSRDTWATSTMGYLAMHEMALNCLISLDWASAALRAVELQDHYGSPALNKYFYGACMEMLGNRSEAILAFAEVTALAKGKKSQLEQYLMRRIEFFELSGYQDMDYSLPGYEILYFWNLFACMKQDVLERCLEEVDRTLNVIFEREKKEYDVRRVELAPDLPPPDYYDQRGVLLLFKSHILTCMGRSTDAIVHLNWIIDNKERIRHSTWVIPYAYWESGMVAWYMNECKRARALWEIALSHSGYSFEYRLSIQLNLAVNHAIDLGVPATERRSSTKGQTNHGRKRLPISTT